MLRKRGGGGGNFLSTGNLGFHLASYMFRKQIQPVGWTISTFLVVAVATLPPLLQLLVRLLLPLLLPLLLLPLLVLMTTWKVNARRSLLQFRTPELSPAFPCWKHDRSDVDHLASPWERGESSGCSTSHEESQTPNCVPNSFLVAFISLCQGHHFCLKLRAAKGFPCTRSGPEALTP